MKLQINKRRKNEQFTKLWKLNNTLLKKTNGSVKKITHKIRKCLKKDENKNTTYQNMTFSESGAKGEIYSYEHLHEKSKVLNQQPNFTS